MLLPEHLLYIFPSNLLNKITNPIDNQGQNFFIFRFTERLSGGVNKNKIKKPKTVESNENKNKTAYVRTFIS